MKYCPKCKNQKSNGEFYNSPKRSDGLRAYCKKCSRIINIENSEYCKNRFRERYKNESGFKEKILTNIKFNKEKNRARDAVKKAIASGKIIRMPCNICSSISRTEAHHKDYSKKLEIVWLCSAHHKAVHIGEIAV